MKGYFIYHSSIFFVVTVVHIHAMKGIPFLDNGILTRNDIQYVHILKFTIWVSVMVLNVTFNNIQLNRGGQFYWWRKPPTCRKSLTKFII